MISLRRQLWRNGVLSILGLSLMLWLSGRWLLQQGLYQQVGGRLAHDAEALLGKLSWTDGTPGMSSPVIGGVYEQPRSGHYFVIVLDDGTRLRSRSLWDERIPVRELPPGKSEIEIVDRLADQTVLLRAAGYHKQGHALTIVVGEEVETVEDVLERLDLAFLLLTALAVVFFLLLQGLAIRKALSPLAGVQAQLLQLSQGERRSIDVAVPQEIKPLLDTLNRLLELVNERMQRSRESLGNLAHALKAPLNLLQQDIASLPDEPVRGELRNAAERIHAIIERELRRARIAGNAMGGEYFMPGRDLPDLSEVLQRLYPGISLSMDVEEGCDQIAFDREDMLELAGNLLDNACKWAREEVLLGVKCNGRQLVLTVSDDGPGIPKGQLSRLLGRGTRLDEQVEGHGLGLSIISGIIESYGGSIRVDDAAGRPSGTVLRVTLPLKA